MFGCFFSLFCFILLVEVGGGWLVVVENVVKVMVFYVFVGKGFICICGGVGGCIVNCL